METVDMKKLETAIVYLQRIADGNNPINNMPADSDSVLNNPNVIRCMFFIKDVLEEVKRNNGYIGKKAKKKEKQEFPIESLITFSYREDMSISKFVEQLNESIDGDVYKKITYNVITRWLKANALLQEVHSPEFNKVITIPTEQGIQAGIRSERRSGIRGDYVVVIYNKQAQEYIIQNIEKIISGEGAD